jgi:hypothetical protein
MNKKLNFRRCAPLDWCEHEHRAGPFHWSESEHFLNILNILNVFRFYESVLRALSHSARRVQQTILCRVYFKGMWHCARVDARTLNRDTLTSIDT